jgi:bifunctional UDP-N-acetylglucosamine pyrophosphorylase / glucosamine-1-phosphate N-acetyltransferase
VQSLDSASQRPVVGVVLAAGEGKRLKSRHPKPLQALCGRPLIDHVLDAVAGLGVTQTIVVVGVGKDEVMTAAARPSVSFAEQTQQLGTGDAAKAAASLLDGFAGDILVTCADTPLVTTETLTRLLHLHREEGAAATVLTAVFDDPTGYGRVVRGDDGLVRAIVEHKDASDAIRAVREINAGIYCFEAEALLAGLRRLRPDNEQAEYYLTDVIALCVQDGRPVAALAAPSAGEVIGINNRVQLAQAEGIARDRIRTRVMLDGVTLMDPASTFIDAAVVIGRDTVIWPGAMILGDTRIGEECEIGPHAYIKDSTIDDGAWIKQASVITNSAVGKRVQVGPFSHIRAQSSTDEDVRIGSYTEVVRSHIGPQTKAQHFTYLGDAQVGARVNVGAGVVTCNYDGKSKHPTVIGDDAFIGSDAIIVAPGEIGARAYVAAGSVVTQPVPEGSLAVGRARQANRPGWADARRAKLESE